jgi:hypothetical protein
VDVTRRRAERLRAVREAAEARQDELEGRVRDAEKIARAAVAHWHLLQEDARRHEDTLLRPLRSLTRPGRPELEKKEDSFLQEARRLRKEHSYGRGRFQKHFGLSPWAARKLAEKLAKEELESKLAPGEGSAAR